ncbi:MAG: hypothetical protein ABI442_01560, partial [Gemmatimonadaceae bacterium]
RVRLTLTDGTVLAESADFPVGNPENPFSTSQLEGKFAGLVAPRWGDDAAQRTIRLVHRLKSVRDMSTTFREIGDGPQHQQRITQGY